MILGGPAAGHNNNIIIEAGYKLNYCPLFCLCLTVSSKSVSLSSEL